METREQDTVLSQMLREIPKAQADDFWQKNQKIIGLTQDLLEDSILDLFVTIFKICDEYEQQCEELIELAHPETESEFRQRLQEFQQETIPDMNQAIEKGFQLNTALRKQLQPFLLICFNSFELDDRVANQSE